MYSVAEAENLIREGRLKIETHMDLFQARSCQILITQLVRKKKLLMNVLQQTLDFSFFLKKL